MKTLKPIVAFGVILLLAAGLFAQDAAVSFRTGTLPATWCPIMTAGSIELPAGSYIMIVGAGADMMVQPPTSLTGVPTGDDYEAYNVVGNGTNHLIMGYLEPPFIPAGNMFTGNGAVGIPPLGSPSNPDVIEQGEYGYLRAFNGPTPDVGTHYNDLITVGGTAATTWMYPAPGPVTTIVCFGDPIEYGGVPPCVPQEFAGPETHVFAAGETYDFFGDDCTLKMIAGSAGGTVTATLIDLEPPCKPFPATTYMTRYYELEGQIDSFFDIYFGYSQTDYDASDFGVDETLLHVAYYNGDVATCTGAWDKVLPTTTTDTPEGGNCHVNTDHLSLWSFGWDGGETQLPVELTSFVAMAGDRMVTLNWVTESETNNRGFFVERSVDGETFARVSQEIEGTNSPTGSDYTYEDQSVNNGVHYIYRLVDVDINGTEYISVLTAEATPSFLASGIVITEYKLHQNYPNPFNPATSLVYDVLEQGHVTLKVFNVMGQEVATLVDSERSNGRYAISFDATGLSSGIYFYTVKMNNFTDTKKMLLVQ